MASASYNAEKGKDPNWQLKTGGVMTDVQSSSMSGTRTSAFGYGVFGNEKASTKLERKAFTGEHIVEQRVLQFHCFHVWVAFWRQVPLLRHVRQLVKGVATAEANRTIR